jgi:hypothetical protein
MSRFPHFLDSWLTDGGEVVSLPRQPATLYLQEDSWYSFLLEAESTPGHSEAGRISSIEKSNDLIGNRNRGLPACSIVPQPTALPSAPHKARALSKYNRTISPCQTEYFPAIKSTLSSRQQQGITSFRTVGWFVRVWVSGFRGTSASLAISAQSIGVLLFLVIRTFFLKYL